MDDELDDDFEIDLSWVEARLTPEERARYREYLKEHEEELRRLRRG